jgi:ATP adenylyltransferase
MCTFRPGELWPRIQQVTHAARASHHLFSIPTESQVIDDAGMKFLIRIVTALGQKQKPCAGQGAPAGNPFLPYDPQLFVANVSEAHVALLNKYMVVDHHLLIVTREFQRQEDPLLAADFDALARCMWEYPSVAFYNSGTLAGASQPHRHLQLVPLPLDRQMSELPIEAKMQLDSAPCERVLRARELPFGHCWWKFSADSAASAAVFADACERAYAALVSSVGWSQVTSDTPYNLQVTRKWMMLVPRRAECFGEISLNGLAFLGALLVRSPSQLRQLITAGPMSALVATAS